VIGDYEQEGQRKRKCCNGNFQRSWLRSVLSRFTVGVNKRLQHAPLGNEKGFIEIQILAMYMVCLLTMMAVGVGICASVWRVATAEYGWFAEAMDFAASAANTNGDIEEVDSNKEKAVLYLTKALDKFMPGSYRLDSFRVVDTGTRVPHGTALSPGYLARITVQIPAVNVPLIGQKNVSVPMTYFAVVRSSKLIN
jgi:hypothetical protein